MPRLSANRKMRIFILIWLGQLVSLLGSQLTTFALDVWVYQSTKSVTLFAIIALCSQLPSILISPLVGVLVDRWNRRWVMILSDTGSAISTGVVALLLATGHLNIWSICLSVILNSIFGAFQWPAYSAAIPLLVPKQHLVRANGITEAGEAIVLLIAPLLAGVLLVSIQLHGVILIDLATFIFALVTLLSVQIPNVKTTTAGETRKGSWLREATYGWTYISVRPGLLGLLIFFTTTNFFESVVEVLVTPLVLSLASPTVLGTIMSISGIGLLGGSLLMSIRGESRRLINSILSFQLLGGLCILLVGLYTAVPIIALAGFLYFFGLPIINGCSYVLWQRKVAPDVQGRVFAMERMISLSSTPLAYLVAGPLADKVFEPLMASNGLLAQSVGKLIGVGPGRGMGLMFVVMGACTIFLTIAAYNYSPLRLVEDELLDEI